MTKMTTTSNRKIQILMFCLTLALLAGMFHLVLHAADAQEQAGMLTVKGRVEVDGKSAATGDIIASGSEVQTAKESSAVVRLGKLGRVDASPSTTMKLQYDETTTTHTPASIAILLGDGRIRVSAEGSFNVEAGMTSTRPSVRTQANEFTVDTTCGITLVSVTKGKVELHEGNSFKVIAAGGQDSAGQAKPGCTPSH